MSHEVTPEGSALTGDGRAHFRVQASLDLPQEPLAGRPSHAAASFRPFLEGELLGREDALVGQGEDQPIHHQGAELLHEIQGGGGPSPEFRMQESHAGIQARRQDGGDRMPQEQGVAEGEQGVDGVPRRTTVASLEAPGGRKRRPKPWK
jgi:hypothetical protein